MPIDIDGYAVLGAISRDPRAFPAIKNDVSKTARFLVVKQLKEKTLSLESLKAIATAVAHDAFALILDLMSDTEVKSLLAKVDKLNAPMKEATPQDQRRQISDLAKGIVAPAAKRPAIRTPKAKAEKPAVERAVNSKAMGAKRKR